MVNVDLSGEFVPIRADDDGLVLHIGRAYQKVRLVSRVLHREIMVLDKSGTVNLVLPVLCPDPVEIEVPKIAVGVGEEKI